MAAQFQYEMAHEASPLHEFELEFEADPFFGKALRRIRQSRRGLWQERFRASVSSLGHWPVNWPLH